jgi:hypothetical protein
MGDEREKQSPCVEYISSAAVGLFFEIFEERHHITQSALEPILRRGPTEKAPYSANHKRVRE